MRKISDIKKDWEAATPGPWVNDGEDVTQADGRGVATTYTEETAKAIANAPTDVIALLNLLDKAKVKLITYSNWLNDEKMVSEAEAVANLIEEIEG